MSRELKLIIFICTYIALVFAAFFWLVFSMACATYEECEATPTPKITVIPTEQVYITPTSLLSPTVTQQPQPTGTSSATPTSTTSLLPTITELVVTPTQQPTEAPIIPQNPPDTSARIE